MRFDKQSPLHIKALFGLFHILVEGVWSIRTEVLRDNFEQTMTDVDHHPPLCRGEDFPSITGSDSYRLNMATSQLRKTTYVFERAASNIKTMLVELQEQKLAIHSSIARLNTGLCKDKRDEFERQLTLQALFAQNEALTTAINHAQSVNGVVLATNLVARAPFPADWDLSRAQRDEIGGQSVWIKGDDGHHAIPFTKHEYAGGQKSSPSGQQPPLKAPLSTISAASGSQSQDFQWQQQVSGSPHPSPPLPQHPLPQQHMPAAASQAVPTKPPPIQPDTYQAPPAKGPPPKAQRFDLTAGDQPQTHQDGAQGNVSFQAQGRKAPPPHLSDEFIVRKDPPPQRPQQREENTYADHSAPRQQGSWSQNHIPPPMGVATVEEFPKPIHELQYGSIPPPPQHGQTDFMGNNDSFEHGSHGENMDLRQRGIEIMARMNDGRNLHGRNSGVSRSVSSYEDLPQPFAGSS